MHSLIGSGFCFSSDSTFGAFFVVYYSSLDSPSSKISHIYLAFYSLIPLELFIFLPAGDVYEILLFKLAVLPELIPFTG